MKPVKIAILSLTHGHTRKYYQVLKENPKLEWIAVYAETEQRLLSGKSKSLFSIIAAVICEDEIIGTPMPSLK